MKIKGIILAAGRGSRMKSYTDERPKCLSIVDGKPLIEWQINAMKDAGIDDIAVVTGYRSEDLSEYSLVEFHNRDWETTNMVSSLICASDWLENSTCIVSYSDIFYTKKAIGLLIKSESSLALTYDINWKNLWTQRFGDPLIDSETFIFDEKFKLKEIGKKPQKIDEINGQYMGLLRFSIEGWSIFSSTYSSLPVEEKRKISMTSLLDKIINQNKLEISAVPYNGIWGEVDSISDLKFYNKN